MLVTGGAGFIGSHLVEALVVRGHRVRVLDNMSSGKLKNLRSVRESVEVVKGECAHYASARRSVRRVDCVFHEAAMPSVARSVKEPLASHRANATATITMLEAARDAGVERFIYAGSSSVYGESPELPKRESMTPLPLSPYAAGKLVGEHYVRMFHELYGMKTLTLRYFNVFGPRQAIGSPYSGVIGLFTRALLDGSTPAIYGDGRQSRDFTYVDNVVHANLLAMKTGNAKGQGLNVAMGQRIDLRQLLRSVAAAIGVTPRSVRRAPRVGDVKHSVADVTLAKRVLGYDPKVDFGTGLARTVEWYRKEA